MRYIKPGDKIAIISPATEVKPHWIHGAVAELKRRGYEPVVMPHAFGPRHGTFAASDAERLSDLKEALVNDDIKAILCARGGYGGVHLLSKEMERIVAENPKWIIGFSDVSVFHALWQKAGVESLHCSMAKKLTLCNIAGQTDEIREAALPDTPVGEEMKDVEYCAETMFSILEGRSDKSGITYEAVSPEGVVCGEAEGAIAGGNLAVLNGLASTPWDILSPEFLRGKILFLEDVGEKIYQVERMLTRLHLSGVFESVAGIIFGKFTDYRPDRNFSSMEEMIASRIKEWGVRVPVALSFPIGHVSCNYPVPEGWHAHLTVSTDRTILEIRGKR